MAQNTLLEKVLSLQEKFTALQEQLASPEAMADMKKFVQLNKDYKELEPIIKAGLEYKKTLDNLASAKDILLGEKDEDLREMAREEIIDKGREGELDDVDRTAHDIALGALNYYILRRVLWLIGFVVVAMAGILFLTRSRDYTYDINNLETIY